MLYAHLWENFDAELVAKFEQIEGAGLIDFDTSGQGHVYQGGFKSFPSQGDAHFLTVCRYVE